MMVYTREKELDGNSDKAYYKRRKGVSLARVQRHVGKYAQYRASIGLTEARGGFYFVRYFRVRKLQKLKKHWGKFEPEKVVGC